MEQLATALQRRLPRMSVRAAHMELCEPGLSTVAAQLASAGARRIVVLPYFLHLGNHLQRDIPALLEELRLRFPTVEFLLGAPLGLDERIVSVLQDRLTDVLQPLGES
jgi:sirohydrochlorin ferrochelatase